MSDGPPDLPRRVMSLLERYGAMSAAELLPAVPHACDILLIMEREGLVVCDGELWRLAAW